MRLRLWISCMVAFGMASQASGIENATGGFRPSPRSALRAHFSQSALTLRLLTDHNGSRSMASVFPDFFNRGDSVLARRFGSEASEWITSEIGACCERLTEGWPAEVRVDTEKQLLRHSYPLTPWRIIRHDLLNRHVQIVIALIAVPLLVIAGLTGYWLASLGTMLFVLGGGLTYMYATDLKMVQHSFGMHLPGQLLIRKGLNRSGTIEAVSHETSHEIFLTESYVHEAVRVLRAIEENHLSMMIFSREQPSVFQKIHSLPLLELQTYLMQEAQRLHPPSDSDSYVEPDWSYPYGEWLGWAIYIRGGEDFSVVYRIVSRVGYGATLDEAVTRRDEPISSDEVRTGQMSRNILGAITFHSTQPRFAYTRMKEPFDVKKAFIKNVQKKVALENIHQFLLLVRDQANYIHRHPATVRIYQASTSGQMMPSMQFTVNEAQEKQKVLHLSLLVLQKKLEAFTASLKDVSEDAPRQNERQLAIQLLGEMHDMFRMIDLARNAFELIMREPNNMERIQQGRILNALNVERGLWDGFFRQWWHLADVCDLISTSEVLQSVEDFAHSQAVVLTDKDDNPKEKIVDQLTLLHRIVQTLAGTSKKNYLQILWDAYRVVQKELEALMAMDGLAWDEFYLHFRILLDHLTNVIWAERNLAWFGEKSNELTNREIEEHFAMAGIIAVIFEQINIPADAWLHVLGVKESEGDPPGQWRAQAAA